MKQPPVDRQMFKSRGDKTKENQPGKLVFLCQVFEPDTSATSQLFSPLIKSYARARDVDVLCGYPSLGCANLKEIPRKETQEGLKIRRLGLRVSYKKNRLHHFLGHLSFQLHAFLVCLTLPKNTLVTATTNPPFNLHILWLTSLIRKVHYQIVFLDLYPEGLIQINSLKSSSLIAKLWFLFNKEAIHRASGLMTIGRDMMKLLEENYAIEKGQIHYLPHWSAIEPKEPLPTEHHPLLEKWNLSDKFVFQYSGNMGIWHDVEALVTAAIELKDTRGHFLFIGNGKGRAAAEKLAEGYDHIAFMDYLPRELLLHSLTACHVSLISMKPKLKGIAVPCKLYGIMAAKRPILACVPEGTEVALTVQEYQCGYVVNPNEPDELVKAMKRLMENPEEAKTMGLRAFQAYHDTYSRQTASQKLEPFFCANSIPSRRKQ
ncbi:MAG: hypothetical protein CSA81_01360 [Acidobacteria bacterium]|nr:MAG: hypothetical protein CSA81_01360 [Acidobacteriota bacterium]